MQKLMKSWIWNVELNLTFLTIALLAYLESANQCYFLFTTHSYSRLRSWPRVIIIIIPSTIRYP